MKNFSAKFGVFSTIFINGKNGPFYVESLETGISGLESHVFGEKILSLFGFGKTFDSRLISHYGLRVL